MGLGSKRRIARQRISDHRELAAALDGFVEAIWDGNFAANILRLGPFLRDQVVAHVCADEAQIHPDISRMFAVHVTAGAMLRADLDDIRRYVDRVEDTISTIEELDEEDLEPVIQIRLRNLVSRLQAALELHVETEERLYLPLLLDRVVVGEQRSEIDSEILFSTP